jgi:hypothetical protein
MSFFIGAYRLEILGREYMFSDQLETVISGLYGHDIAEVLYFLNMLLFTYVNDFFSQHTHFYVDHKRVNRHSLLDEHQGKDVHVYYADHIHDPNRYAIYTTICLYIVLSFFRIGSFSIPVLEHHQTLRHHETGVIK